MMVTIMMASIATIKDMVKERYIIQMVISMTVNMSTMKELEEER